MTARIDNNRSGTVVGETGVDLDLAPQIHRYGIEIIFEQFWLISTFMLSVILKETQSHVILGRELA